jgi:hypothetical protein
MKQVSVYNTLGQCALQKNVEESQISLDLQGLSSGLYLLRVRTTEGEMSRRITVER